MKILLIHPYCLEERINKEDISVPPIGIYYVGAVLKENNYDVEILNWYNIDKTPKKIRETFLDKKPDIIGFSILHATRWGGIEIARVAKEIDPSVKIVFGGIGTTFLWRHLLTHFNEIDFTIIGEGEYTFLNLVKCFENKDPKGIENISGIAFRKRDDIVCNKQGELISDLDELPNPSKFFTYQHVVLTRGCPGNCTFCSSPKIWKRKVRAHSSSYFVDQLEHLYHKGVRFFYFSDDTFTFNKELVIDICKKIIERNLQITWAAISRVNFINEEILYWMRRAGCVQISYGVESGSEKIRKQLNKNIKTDQIKSAFKLTTSYGILARAYFIYGSRGENRDTIQETIDLINEIKPLSIIFYILDIFPGTKIYQDFLERTQKDDDIWLDRIEDILYFETDENLSRENVLAFGRKLRTSFYKNLSSFTADIRMVDKEELFPLHADFFSKLAMTFSHGDYAKIKEIKEKVETARVLFEKSLNYFPNHRAFLGLGIILQQTRSFEESIRILSSGIKHFPESEQLNMCLGISYMNVKRFQDALLCFNKMQNSKETAQYIKTCNFELGRYK